MTKTESMKLFRYMEERFTAMDRRLDDTATKSDVESLRSAIDGLYSLYDIHDSEIAAHNKRINRLEAA